MPNTTPSLRTTTLDTRSPIFNNNSLPSVIDGVNQNPSSPHSASGPSSQKRKSGPTQNGTPLPKKRVRFNPSLLMNAPTPTPVSIPCKLRLRPSVISTTSATPTKAVVPLPENSEDMEAWQDLQMLATAICQVTSRTASTTPKDTAGSATKRRKCNSEWIADNRVESKGKGEMEDMIEGVHRRLGAENREENWKPAEMGSCRRMLGAVLKEVEGFKQKLAREVGEMVWAVEQERKVGVGRKRQSSRQCAKVAEEKERSRERGGGKRRDCWGNEENEKFMRMVRQTDGMQEMRLRRMLAKEFGPRRSHEQCANHLRVLRGHGKLPPAVWKKAELLQNAFGGDGERPSSVVKDDGDV